MKKIVLSAAIAAICAAPLAAMADTNLYGQMRYSFNSVDDKDNGKDGLSGNDNVSLFGLKGSAGDDIKAFYQSLIQPALQLHSHDWLHSMPGRHLSQ